MAAGWYQFQLHVVLVTNEVLHGLGNFIIQDMFLGRDVGSFEATEEGLIGACHFLILAILHWLDQDAAAVDLDHDHHCKRKTPTYSRDIRHHGNMPANIPAICRY